MKMKKYGSFDEYFADQSPKNRSIIRTLRTFVKRVVPRLTESVKWGNGCWVMGNVPVAYVYSAPGYVQFGFFRGSGLKDPQRVLEGRGQYVRHIKVRKASDIIKILPTQLSNDPIRRQRFEREAKTISSLNHPHICVLHDIGSQNGINYLVMECVEGETLAKRLAKGPLPLEQVLKYGAEIADLWT